LYSNYGIKAKGIYKRAENPVEGRKVHTQTGLESSLQSGGTKLTLTVAELFFSTNFKLAGNPMLVFAIFRHLTAYFSSFERHFARQVQFLAIFMTLHCQGSLHVVLPPFLSGWGVKVTGALASPPPEVLLTSGVVSGMQAEGEWMALLAMLTKPIDIL